MSFLKDNWLIIVIAVIALFLAILSPNCLPDGDYWQGIAVEIAGVAYDVILITLVLGVYDRMRSKKDKINELRRRINDFKKLDNDYSKTIIGSSLRELYDCGVTDIDFNGMNLTNVGFLNHFGVNSICNSVFATKPLKMEFSRDCITLLENVSFHDVDCTGVIFSKSDASLGNYKNCDFRNCNLNGALFNNAFLEWDNIS